MSEVKVTLENVADCFSAKMQYELIHIAAELNMTKELKCLLHNESPVDSPDKYGFTPLHRASNQGSIGKKYITSSLQARKLKKVQAKNSWKQFHEFIIFSMKIK